jgi:hypothetical protein
MSDATIGSVLLATAEKLGGSDAAAKVIDEGLTIWKAEQTVAWWDAFDGGIQRVTAEAIKQWPHDVPQDGMFAVVNVAKAVLAETAGVMGIPDSMLPFQPAPDGEDR